jgi:imidazolonepropionase-like amidohydrolase
MLFENVKVFDGNKTIPSGYVLVEAGQISYVGADPPPSLSSNTHRISGSGKKWTLLPGLIDSHIHAHLHPGKGSEQLKPPMKLGVTTILDMHNEPEDSTRLKKECGASSDLPDLKSAYHGATIEGGWPKPIVLTLDPSEEVGDFDNRSLPIRIP